MCVSFDGSHQPRYFEAILPHDERNAIYEKYFHRGHFDLNSFRNILHDLHVPLFPRSGDVIGLRDEERDNPMERPSLIFGVDLWSGVVYTMDDAEIATFFDKETRNLYRYPYMNDLQERQEPLPPPMNAGEEDIFGTDSEGESDKD